MPAKTSKGSKNGKKYNENLYFENAIRFSASDGISSWSSKIDSGCEKVQRCDMG